MNQIVNKFLLAEDKFMSEMHLRQAGFTIMHLDHLLEINKEFKKIYKQGIQITFARMNWIKLIFNMI